jgi:alkylhydroperoxidase family enzyme
MADPIDDLRAVVAATPAAPAAMATYLAKVADRAYTVADADVEALSAAGLTDDEIFEQTVAAAISQGLRRLDAANAAIG